MLKQDVPVWWRFLEKWGYQFDKIYYDCLLGGPHLSPQEEKDPLKRSWRASLAKRADAIATTSTNVYIIEVATDPGLRALGQLQVYQSLWIRDPVIPLPERLVLVAETIDKDLLDAAGMHSLQIYLV